MSEIAKALVEVQANLPKVHASRTADTGKYTYKYADLADITAKVLPLLNKNGLVFSAVPDVVDGEFVLRCALLHTSGESLEGGYLLPKGGSPQQQGSAITYGRRYSLCALVGLVADDDDDAQAAETVEPASDVLMASVDEWIDKAAEAGVEVDAEKVRAFAVTSKVNAERSIGTLRKRIDAAGEQ